MSDPGFKRQQLCNRFQLIDSGTRLSKSGFKQFLKSKLEWMENNQQCMMEMFASNSNDKIVKKDFEMIEKLLSNKNNDDYSPKTKCSNLLDLPDVILILLCEYLTQEDYFQYESLARRIYVILNNNRYNTSQLSELHLHSESCFQHTYKQLMQIHRNITSLEISFGVIDEEEYDYCSNNNILLPKLTTLKIINTAGFGLIACYGAQLTELHYCNVVPAFNNPYSLKQRVAALLKINFKKLQRLKFDEIDFEELRCIVQTATNLSCVTMSTDYHTYETNVNENIVDLISFIFSHVKRLKCVKIDVAPQDCTTQSNSCAKLYDGIITGLQKSMSQKRDTLTLTLSQWLGIRHLKTILQIIKNSKTQKFMLVFDGLVLMDFGQNFFDHSGKHWTTPIYRTNENTVKEVLEYTISSIGCTNCIKYVYYDGSTEQSHQDAHLSLTFESPQCK